MRRVYFCLSFFYYFFGFPRVLPGLFNSAHPIIRDRERTSSRLFLLPGTAVGRTDRGGAHWLGCCYVLRLCRAEGRSPAALAVGQECLARRDTRGSRCGSTEPPGGSPKEWEFGWVRNSRKSWIFTSVYGPMRESESEGGAERGAWLFFLKVLRTAAVPSICKYYPHEISQSVTNIPQNHLLKILFNYERPQKLKPFNLRSEVSYSEAHSRFHF